VWIFDAQSAGLPAREALLAVLGPAGCELVLIAAAAWLLVRSPHGGPPPGRREPRARSLLASAAVLAFAGLAVGVVPLLVVAHGTLAGLPAVPASGRLLHEIAVSLLVATCASLCAWTLARAARRRGSVAILSCAPGLAGALVVALAVQALFQLGGL